MTSRFLPSIETLILTETLTAADELGVSLTVDEARQLGFQIVKTRFAVCVRERLQLRGMAPQTPPD